MARRRRRRRSSSRRSWILGLLAAISGVWLYGRYISPVLEGRTEPTPPVTTKLADARPTNTPTPGRSTAPTRRNNTIPGPKLTSKRPERNPNQPAPTVAEKGADDTLTARRPGRAPDARAEQVFQSGINAFAAGDWVTSRSLLTDALAMGLSGQNWLDARAALTQLSKETIFSSRIIDGDPLVRRVKVKSGESLSRIASKFSVTADFLAAINGIRNKNHIRAGQPLKVVEGPFNIRVNKSNYRLDLYLQGVFVRHYAVGLGADDSTPTGMWQVGTKLSNPTYYPPRGGAIVAADDPSNPLGEHWIELKGVSGAAVGQERYGIHGTIHPESIGKSESMGCVRMHNADVAEVFSYVVSKKSQVEIVNE